MKWYYRRGRCGKGVEGCTDAEGHKCGWFRNKRLDSDALVEAEAEGFGFFKTSEEAMEEMLRLGRPSMGVRYADPIIEIHVGVAVAHDYRMGTSLQSGRFEQVGPGDDDLLSYEDSLCPFENPLKESMEREQEVCRQVDLGKVQIMASASWLERTLRATLYSYKYWTDDWRHWMSGLGPVGV